MITVLIPLLIDSCYSAMVSYNQPKLCPNATWNSTGITFADKDLIGSQPYGIFISSNDTIYVASREFSKILIWINNDTIPMQIQPENLKNPLGLFIVTNSDIYVDNGGIARSIDKWISKCSMSTSVVNVTGRCWAIFVDINNTLYCSNDLQHIVIKVALNGDSNKVEIAAGNGTAGKESPMLYWPDGIFVDTSLNLYVADSNNHRILRFSPGELNGITLASNDNASEIKLRGPTGIAFDYDENLYIADQYNNRIVKQVPNGFLCIIGCLANPDPATIQLNTPQYLSFDSYGNLYVSDLENHRIQKYTLTNNECDKTSTTSQQTLLSTNKASSFVFVPLSCNSTTIIGINCTTSATRCDLLRPCKNNNSCTDNKTDPRGYTCNCSSSFNGTHCEFDYRPCQPHGCWNEGTCNQTSSKCLCSQGWHGDHCERKINFCHNISCHDHGVCRPLLNTYKCECFGDSYFGEHCQFTANKIAIKKIVSRSFAYIAILAMCSVAMFVLIMDVLKYCFGIDPVDRERWRLRRERQVKKKRKPIIQRFVYVNAAVSAVAETAV